jgi:hypothetical protein
VRLITVNEVSEIDELTVRKGSWAVERPCIPPEGTCTSRMDQCQNMAAGRGSVAPTLLHRMTTAFKK